MVGFSKRARRTAGDRPQDGRPPRRERHSSRGAAGLSRGAAAVLLGLASLAAAACRTRELRAEENALPAPARVVRATVRPVGDRPVERLEGRVEARTDVELLLVDRFGRLRRLDRRQIESEEETGEAFRPASTEDLAEELRREFGARFTVHRTEHYAVAFSGTALYAETVGLLLERQLSVYRNHANALKLPYAEPEFALPVVVLADRQAFDAFALGDVGPTGAQSDSYFNAARNGTVLFELTAGDRGTARTRVQVLAQLAARPTSVSTFVHEATHQLAFNTGFSRRYADNPLWLVEGWAMYFENADVARSSTPRNVGGVNRPRLLQYRGQAGEPAPEAWRELVRDDRRLADAETGPAAYPQAWALTFYLVKRRPREFAAYVERMANKPALLRGAPEERLADFQQAFGSDFEALSREIQRFLGQQR